MPAGLQLEVAQLIASTLNLEMPAEQVDPDKPLFGDGLGLDSIDILEIALEITKKYGFELRSDDENRHQIFASLSSLAEHVGRNRVR